MESNEERTFSSFALWPFALSPSSHLEYRREAWRFSSQIVATRQQWELKVSKLRIVKRKIERARVRGVIYKAPHRPVTTRPRLIIIKVKIPCLSRCGTVSLFAMSTMPMIHEPARVAPAKFVLLSLGFTAFRPLYWPLLGL